MFYLIYLLFLALYNSVTENLKHKLNDERVFLKKLAGRKLSKEETEYLWSKISDHKWFISEKLGRDVGFEVAAADYLKNIRPVETIKRPDFSDSDSQVYTAFSSFA